MDNSELNKNYSIVSNAIDTYLKKWKVSINGLERFLSNKSNMDKFLSNNDLLSIDRVEKIIKDVMLNKKVDGIIKFESFSNVDENKSKILSDYFNISISHVDCINENTSKFKIDDFGDKKYCYVYSSDDLDVNLKSIIDEMIENLTSKKLSLKNGISIELDKVLDLVRLNEHLSNKIDSEYVVNYLIEKNNINISEYKKTEYNGYILFVQI